MSGQPYRYASDPEKYRVEYMRNLNERTLLDQKVYDAVTNYIANGSLPAISQLPDTRSTSEKLLDIEGLKKGIINDFSEIMDSQTAIALIQGLIQSPLNIDNKLLIFVSQRAPEISKELTKKYKYGIKGDVNDIYTFVDFMNTLYANKNNSTASVKSIMDRGYASGSGTSNSDDLRSYSDELQRIFTNIIIGNMNVFNQGLLEEIRAILTTLIPKIPSKNQMLEITNYFINTPVGMNAQYDQLNRILTWITESMPNKEILKSLTYSLRNYMIGVQKRGGILDPNDISITQYLQKINELFPSVADIDGNIPTTAENIVDYIRNDLHGRGGDVIPLGEGGQNLRPAPNPAMIGLPAHAPPPPPLGGVGGVPAGGAGGAPPPVVPVAGAPWYAPYLPARFGGVGLPKRRRGRPKGSGVLTQIPIEFNIDRDRGIEQSLKFSPFGKYLIHNAKLRDNVISLKTGTGANVIGLPSTKVSNHLGKIVKTIIGGGIISFEDMNKMSDDEKKYLHTIASKSNIIDKLNIPSPSKDQEEKDLHLFEVYKGEVMAGNDSKELIQKFKALLFKLSKNGTLPKQQVNEILNEILALGY